MAEPMYRRIAEDLRYKIESGLLAPGAPLPSEEELREEYGQDGRIVSRNTVRDAVKLLVSRGLIETRPGQGTFVLKKMTTFITKLNTDPGSGISDSMVYKSQVEAPGRTPDDTLRVEIQRSSDLVAYQFEGDQVILRHQARSNLRGELSGSLLLVDRITTSTISLPTKESDYRLWYLDCGTVGEYDVFLACHGFTENTYYPGDRQTDFVPGVSARLLLRPMQVFISVSEEVAQLHAAVVASMLTAILLTAWVIVRAICSVFVFIRAAKAMIRMIMAHRNSREPAYYQTSHRSQYQFLAGAALAH